MNKNKPEEEVTTLTNLWGPISLPLKHGDTVSQFSLWYFHFGTKRWVAAMLGDVQASRSVPLRIESACFFGHVMHSQQCDCGFQLDEAFRRISALKYGMVIYGVDDDARGLGLEAHFRIYRYRQAENLDTQEVYKLLDAPLDSRDYQAVAQILRFLKVRNIQLLSNNKQRLKFLTQEGFQVTSEALEAPITRYNMATLMLEKEDLGYTWSFRTHGEWLQRIQSTVQGNLELGMATLVRDTHVLVAEATSNSWDLARSLLAQTEQRGETTPELVVYLTDLPRKDELPLYRSLGAAFVVLPFSVIPDWLKKAGIANGIKVQDWGRSNRYLETRPQWELVEETPEKAIYVRNQTVRTVYLNDEGHSTGWEESTQKRVAHE